jgi:hypothetical protein
MKRDLNDSNSEIFEIFADIVEREKLMDKTAEYGLLPDTLFEQNKTGEELDINMAVIASEHGKLYGVTHETGEQLVGDAHPKGTKTNLDNNKPSEKNLDLVETIVEQHKTNEGIALKTPSGKVAALSERLSKLADVMDNNGFKVLADKLDEVLTALAASPNDFGTHVMNESGAKIQDSKKKPSGLTMGDVDKEIGRAYPESESPGPAGYNKRHQIEKVEIEEPMEITSRPAGHNPAPTSIAEGHQVAKNLLGIPEASDAVLINILNQRGIKYGTGPGQYHDWESLYSLIQNSSPAEAKPAGRDEFIGLDAVPAQSSQKSSTAPYFEVKK